MTEYIVYEDATRRSIFPDNIRVREADEQLDEARPIGIPIDFFGRFSVKVQAETEDLAKEPGISLINAAKHQMGHHITVQFDAGKYKEALEILSKPVPVGTKRGHVDIRDGILWRLKDDPR